MQFKNNNRHEKKKPKKREKICKIKPKIETVKQMQQMKQRIR